MFAGTLQDHEQVTKYGRTYEEDVTRDWDSHGTGVADLIKGKGPDCIRIHNFKVSNIGFCNTSNLFSLFLVWVLCPLNIMIEFYSPNYLPNILLPNISKHFLQSFETDLHV